MSALLDRLRARFPVSPRLYAVSAWAALFFFSLIVSTGAGVRLTGSGLGCPDWPNCNEEALTPELHGHALIEFGNRTLTGPVTLAAVATLLFALLRRPYRRDFTVLGALMVGTVVGQAVVGGVTVLTGLNPWTVMAHFLLSIVSLVFAATLVWRVMRERSGRTERPEHDWRLVWLVRAWAVVGAFVVVLGSLTTAAGPYTGGEGTGDRVERLKAFGSFGDLIAAHSRVAMGFGIGAVVLWVLARVWGACDLRAPLTGACLSVAAVGFCGTLQYHVFNYPATLVWIHITLVTVLWTMVIWSVLAAGRAVRVREAAAAPKASGETATA